MDETPIEDSAGDDIALFDHLHSGKVRDLYRTPEGLLLLVASDRISALTTSCQRRFRTRAASSPR